MRLETLKRRINVLLSKHAPGHRDGVLYELPGGRLEWPDGRSLAECPPGSVMVVPAPLSSAEEWERQHASLTQAIGMDETAAVQSPRRPQEDVRA